MINKYLIISLILFLFLASCIKKINPSIGEGQYLLYNQTYKDNKFFSGDDLSPYIKQKPNSKILGIRATMGVYNFGKLFYDVADVESEIKVLNAKFDKKKANADTSKVKKIEKRRQRKLAKLQEKLENGNWIMRKLGSAPVVFDTAMAARSCKELAGFLKTKGCFNARVSYKIDTLLSAIFITYLFEEGKRFKINELKFYSEDGNLKRLVNEHLELVLLDTNSYYDELKLIAERDRLEKIFRSNGYYDFNKKYIDYELDTVSQKLKLTVNIRKTTKDEYHKIYRLNAIKVKVDQSDLLETEDSAITRDYKNVHFAYGQRMYRPKILYGKTEIAAGQKYNFTYSQNTQRNLSQLEVFKYVNLTYQKDSSTQTLVANIEAASNTKFQISDEIGFSVSQGLPGPFGSLTFLSRNVFNGCELFEINLRGGIEGVASATNSTQFYQSQEVSLSTALTFPRLFFLFNLNPTFINNNPRTRLQLSYSFISRPEYRRTNTRLSMTYFLSKGVYNQFSFSLIDINYLRTPFLQSKFSDDLTSLNVRTGNNLFRSFQPSIASNINFGYTFNDFILGQNKNATYFRIYAESGGTTLNFLPKKTVADLKNFAEVQSLFVYWKLNMDLRKYFPLSKKSTFATRFNIGVANPYAGDGVLPYEKYFFSGGSNSNRAWLPRRLGPGSYAIFDSNGMVNYNFEQPGLVQLEINSEYRFKIYKFVDGALFVDAGNVWLLNDSDQRKNFDKDFVSQIAIGSGYGIRLDFSFLVVRLDAGYKTYDPAQVGDRWVIKKTNFLNLNDLYSKATWNIAVGYPF